MSNPFSAPRDVFNWLNQFVQPEQNVKPPRMRPERMRIIARAAGNPENCAGAIHVAGSKGKGSVTAMASAILAAAGYRVARYLSPHITEYRERITLNNDFFDDAVYLRAGERLYTIQTLIANPQSEWYAELASVSNNSPPAPTFFELLTLYYFLCAEEADCNALAVETGMGGRLDPTNIAHSRAVVITGIELEHTDILGGTIAEIAAEKAGIIKENTPLILARQIHRDAHDALAVFYETARQKNAPLFYVPAIAAISDVEVTRDGTSWTLRCADGFFDAPLRFSIPLIGEVQAENTTLAVLAVRRAYPEIPVDVIQRAVSTVRLPARFETVCDNPRVVVDGAHTDISVQLCVKTWRTLYGENGVLIFGCAQGKDAAAMAQNLAPHFSKIIITAPGAYKISEPEKVYKAFCAAAAHTQKNTIEFIQETKAGIERALAYAKEHNEAVLGTGSFYLAAEIRAYLEHRAIILEMR